MDLKIPTRKKLDWEIGFEPAKKKLNPVIKTGKTDQNFENYREKPDQGFENLDKNWKMNLIWDGRF